MSAILNSPNRSRVALWDTRFVEVSWRNNVFRACYASTILNKGTLLSNGENNITASHSVSVCNVHFLIAHSHSRVRETTFRESSLTFDLSSFCSNRSKFCLYHSIL